jgi:hypothetical protein
MSTPPTDEGPKDEGGAKPPEPADSAQTTPPQPATPAASTPPAPHWSEDGESWWDGEKWISAAEANALPNPPAPPKPVQKRGRLVRNAALILVALLVAAALGVLAGRAGNAPQEAQVSATTQPSPSASPSAQATAQASPKPEPSAPPSHPSSGPSQSPSGKVLVNMQGTGGNQTGEFSAPTAWRLTYSFDCSTTASGTGMAVDLYQGGSMVKELVAQSGTNGGSTIDVELGGERMQLVIRSECSWRVTGTA